MITLILSIIMFWGSFFDGIYNFFYAPVSWTDNYDMCRYITDWDNYMKEKYLLENPDVRWLGYEAAYHSYENITDFYNNKEICTDLDKWFIEYLKDPNITGKGFWESLEEWLIKDLECVKNDTDPELPVLRMRDILGLYYS